MVGFKMHGTIIPVDGAGSRADLVQVFAPLYWPRSAYGQLSPRSAQPEDFGRAFQQPIRIRSAAKARSGSKAPRATFDHRRRGGRGRFSHIAEPVSPKTCPSVLSLNQMRTAAKTLRLSL